MKRINILSLFIFILLFSFYQQTIASNSDGQILYLNKYASAGIKANIQKIIASKFPKYDLVLMEKYTRDSLKRALDKSIVTMISFNGEELDSSDFFIYSLLRKYVENGGTLVVDDDKENLVAKAGMMNVTYYFYSSDYSPLGGEKNSTIFQKVSTYKCPKYCNYYQVDDNTVKVLAHVESKKNQAVVAYKEIGRGQVYLMGFYFSEYSSKDEDASGQIFANIVASGLDRVLLCKPDLKLQLNKNEIKIGRALKLKFFISHECEDKKEVLVMPWLQLPDFSVRQIDGGAFYMTLIANEDFEGSSKVQIDDSYLKGNYTLGYRFLDSITGHILAEDKQRFKVK